MTRIAVFLSGLGFIIIGASSYVAGIPLIIDCRSVLCTIGTSIITVDMVVMTIGALLILISTIIMRKNK